MATKTLGSSLKPEKTIGLSTGSIAASGRFTSNNRVDIYRFRLGKSGSLSLNLDGLATNVDIQVIQDRNKNGILNSGEIIGRARSRSGQVGTLSIPQAKAGTYYLRVIPQGQTAKYRLVARLGSAIASPTSSFATEVVKLTNDFRAQNGLQPLALNTKLVNAAQGHSQNMALADFFSHTGANGSTLGSRLQSVSYSAATAGENIAAGQSTPSQVVQSWINSPGHRANILNPNFTQIGVGYYYLANDTGAVNYNRYWTQVFGKPL